MAPVNEDREAAPIRVCLLGPSLDILGGQAVQLRRLLDRLATTPGVEVGFIPMNPRVPGILEPLQRVKYIRTVVTSIAYWLLLLRRARRYDVLHAFSPSYWAFLLGPVPALVAARLWGRKVVLNYHSGEAEDHLRRWRHAVPLVRRFDRIVVPSGYLREAFASFGLEALAIHNFVDVDRIPFRHRDRVRPMFLSNRNLEPMYNVACCIRAFAAVQSRVPEAQLVVAGYGSQRGALEQLVRDLGLRSVTFTGRVPPDEMGRLLDRADILLNSPEIDNMPLSLIEAQAAGVPIVSTATGGIPWIVTNERTGLLVPVGDCEAMATAALRLLSEDGLARRLSVEGRAACLSGFTWSSVEQEWLDLYRDVTRDSGQSRA
jgi:glycosyltransferase involved in cell wall biosynthesis